MVIIINNEAYHYKICYMMLLNSMKYSKNGIKNLLLFGIEIYKLTYKLKLKHQPDKRY